MFFQSVTELAWLAHARRKFYDLHAANQSQIAAKELKHIAELYDNKREGKPMASEDRHALRRHQAKLEVFHTWLQEKSHLCWSLWTILTKPAKKNALNIKHPTRYFRDKPTACTSE